MRYAFAAAITCALGLPVDVLAQVRAGPEFQANSYTTSFQWFPEISMERDGDFVIVWNSKWQDGSYGGVYSQRFGAEGAFRGPEFRVNSDTTGSQNYEGRAAAATNRTGDFVVIWAGGDGDLWGVFGRRFSADGAPRGGDFLVNTTTSGSQGGGGTWAGWYDVGMDAAGNFVVVYASSDIGGGSEVFGQRFGASGNRIGGEFQVNSVTPGDQLSPAVSMTSSGDFVVAWQTPDGDGTGVAARRFDGAGNPIGVEFLVNAYTTGQQLGNILTPAVHLSGDGTFVVAWNSPQDGYPDGVFARRFSATGAPIGVEFQVNSYTTGTQGGSTIGADAAGNFILAWMSYGQDGQREGVFARRYFADGTPRGPEFQVNAYTTHLQTGSVVAVDEVGNFAVTWWGTGPAGFTVDVFAQRFGGLTPAALTVDGSGNGVLEPGETVDVRPSWRNVNGAAQTFSATLANISGPAGATHAITDGGGDYGTVPNGTPATCVDCYGVSVASPPTRPVTHWDASAVEGIVPDSQGQRKRWLLHVGDSFTDVPRNNGFYRFVEALLHHGVTGGCTAATYCATSATTREQMAVFVLVAKEGAGYAPPACGAAPLFGDVPVTNPFCRWVEELARRGIVGGCGGGYYCPGVAVPRDQMAVFVLRTLDPTSVPPACAPPNLFADVPETSPFCRWVEELANRAIVSGCGGGNYCPASPVTREQMGVFIGASFGLTLYGP